MTHSHLSQSHHPRLRTDPVIQRRLLFAVAPFALLTIVGLLALWPRGTVDVVPQGQFGGPEFDATIATVDVGGCEAPAGADEFTCNQVEIRLDEGPDEGTSFEVQFSGGQGGRQPEVGDPVTVARADQPTQGNEYYFVDYRRDLPLVFLAVLFAVVVVGLSRWYGLASLAGVALSLLVLTTFVMPAILEGKSPLLVATVGSAAVMFLTLYLAHGVNARTTTAILGTLASLGLTILLATVFVELCRFTGFGSEEATFLQLSADKVNLEGLLLGGIVIGTLGVLDDVTVTQASAIWELRAANPALRPRELYRSGIRIGRDHIASTVNTLVLAYAGASLPLLILFTISNRSLSNILTSEVMAEEIVRTLVGSVGLVASVPITTALAAAVVGSHARRPRQPKARREAPA